MLKKIKCKSNHVLDTVKFNELREIADESKLNKGPDIVLCHTEIDETNFRKISECQCFLYSSYDYWYSKGSLVKARITAGNSELTHLETTYFLSRTISLKIENKVITSFQKTQKLPIFYTKTIFKNSKNDTLKVNTWCYEDYTPFELPEYSPIFLTFTIDQNEIFSVTFNEKPNVNSIGDKSHLSIINTSDKHTENSLSKTGNTLSSYSIPKVQAPFNIGKNTNIQRIVKSKYFIKQILAQKF